MSFLGTPLPAPAAEEPPIVNDGWFPDVDPAQARDALRLDGTVTPVRLRAALVAAIAGLNDELRDYAAAQRAQGVAKLADVPSHKIDGESTQLMQYRRAVHCIAKADLIERYRDFDTTGQGDKRAAELEESVCDLRRNARWAVSDLLGLRRTVVELI